MNEVNIATWIANFNASMYDSKEVNIQIKAGWYDWFCKDTSLAFKTKQMGNIIKKLRRDGKVNLTDTYVWFKNNYPLKGKLYDDFRITDCKIHNTLFLVTMDSPRGTKKYSVYEKINEFQSPTFETDHQKELVDWFNKPGDKHV